MKRSTNEIVLALFPAEPFHHLKLTTSEKNSSLRKTESSNMNSNFQWLLQCTFMNISSQIEKLLKNIYIYFHEDRASKVQWSDPFYLIKA